MPGGTGPPTRQGVVISRSLRHAGAAPVTRITLPSSLVIAALSRALDLAEGVPQGHALRTCWIGMALAEALELPAPVRHDLYYSLLLKDAGCSATAARVTQWLGADDRAAKRALKTSRWSSGRHAVWDTLAQARPDATLPARAWQWARLGRRSTEVSRELAEVRCARGAETVRHLGWTDPAAEAVLMLDEHWDGSGAPMGLRGETIPLLSRLTLLAQTVELFWQAGGPAAARTAAQRRRGKWLDPELVDVLLAISRPADFWANLATIDGPGAVSPLDPYPVQIDGHSPEVLLRVARVFAGVVDAKSPWTSHHSSRTAAYARACARVMGYAPARRDRLTVAALLHDIGTLGVSNLILDKPGRLTAVETDSMRAHTTLTHQILAPLSPLVDIADLASAHHERLDGTGYHRGLRGVALTEECTVLAVADVFGAVTSARPHRAAMTPEQALDLMAPEVGQGLGVEAYEALCTVVAAGGPAFT